MYSSASALCFSQDMGNVRNQSSGDSADWQLSMTLHEFQNLLPSHPKTIYQKHFHCLYSGAMCVQAAHEPRDPIPNYKMTLTFQLLADGSSRPSLVGHPLVISSDLKCSPTSLACTSCNKAVDLSVPQVMEL